MTPMKKLQCKERVCVEAVRISLGQMVSIKRRNFHRDLRKITRQKSLQYSVGRIYHIERVWWFWDRTKGFSPKLISMKFFCIGRNVDIMIFSKNLRIHKKIKWRKSVSSNMLYWQFLFSFTFLPVYKTGLQWWRLPDF